GVEGQRMHRGEGNGVRGGSMRRHESGPAEDVSWLQGHDDVRTAGGHLQSERDPAGGQDAQEGCRSALAEDQRARFVLDGRGDRRQERTLALPERLEVRADPGDLRSRSWSRGELIAFHQWHPFRPNLAVAALRKERHVAPSGSTDGPPPRALRCRSYACARLVVRGPGPGDYQRRRSRLASDRSSSRNSGAAMAISAAARSRS